MSDISISAQLLINSIEIEAAKEEKKIYESANEYKKQRLEAVRDEIKSRCDKKLEFARLELSDKSNELCARMTEDYKARLQKLRESTAKAVLDDVNKRLCSFVKSDGYKQYLGQSAKSAAMYCDEKCTVYVRSDDVKLSDVISVALKNASVETDDSIKLGGFRADFPDKHITLDFTLDSAFEDEKDEFVRSCDFDF